MTKIDLEFFGHYRFLSSLLKQCFSIAANVHISRHVAWESKTSTYNIMEVVYEQLNKITTDDFRFNFLPVVTELLSIEDSLSDWRIEFIVQGEFGIMTMMQNTSNDIRILSLWMLLVESIQTNLRVAQYFIRNRTVFLRDIESQFEERIREFEFKFLRQDPPSSELFLNVRDSKECYRTLKKLLSD